MADILPAPDPTRRWTNWLIRIEARKKVFEDGWWKSAAAAEKMYEIQKTENTGDGNPFNVLFANTEVLLPSLYSNTPRPDVATRNKMGRQEVAKAAEAFLTSFIDMNSPGRESFDEAVEMATLCALVPGSGHVRLRAFPGESCPLRSESGNYKELIWAKARSWAKVPWIAFIHTMTKDDIVRQFQLTPEQASQVGAVTQEDADKSPRDKGPDAPSLVYELWIKETREIAFLCKDYKPILLRAAPDDLKLTGFYPTPGPLRLVVKTGSLDPTPIYEFYRNQAEELNRVTVRLNKVLSAIRVRGAYNPLLGDDIKNILGDNQMENALVAAQSPLGLEGKGFEGHIWLMPLEKLIQVATSLYAARVQIMGVIQQITGLSDIVRGSTMASETATAQDLKNKWGTIRLARMQKRVAAYVRDLLRLAINAGANVLDEATWKSMCQLPFPTSGEKAQAALALRTQQAQAQQLQALSPPGAPPPQLPPPDPQLVAAAQSPSWADIISALQDDNSRVYIIDVETDSTVSRDATSDKQEVGEFMVAMGQLLAGLAPLAQLGPSGLGVMKELLIAVTSKYKFGREVKESLEKLELPPPSQPSPQDQAAGQKAQVDLQVAQKEAANKVAQLELDRQIAAAQHLSDLDQIQLKRAQVQAQHEMLQLKVQGARDKAAAQKAMAPPPSPKKAS